MEFKSKQSDFRVHSLNYLAMRNHNFSLVESLALSALLTLYHIHNYAAGCGYFLLLRIEWASFISGSTAAGPHGLLNPCRNSVSTKLGVEGVDKRSLMQNNTVSYCSYIKFNTFFLKHQYFSDHSELWLISRVLKLFLPILSKFLETSVKKCCWPSQSAISGRSIH